MKSPAPCPKESNVGPLCRTRLFFAIVTTFPCGTRQWSFYRPVRQSCAGYQTVAVTIHVFSATSTCTDRPGQETVWIARRARPRLVQARLAHVSGSWDSSTIPGLQDGLAP